MKFNFSKIDDKMSFNIWKIQIMAVLTHNKLSKALDSKTKKFKSMTDEQWENLDEKVLSTIQLCLAPHVILEVLENAMKSLLLAKEAVYMTKSLANKILLKEICARSLWPNVLTFKIILMISIPLLLTWKVWMSKLRMRTKLLLWQSHYSLRISTSRKFCYIVITLYCLLRT